MIGRPVTAPGLDEGLRGEHLAVQDHSAPGGEVLYLVAPIVQGGRVVGASDAKGAFPRANPKTPQDVLATLYRHLGVDTTVQYVNPAGRPITVLPSGTAIEELG